MKEPRRIDAPHYQAADDLEAHGCRRRGQRPSFRNKCCDTVWRLATTLNVAHTEAKLAFQRQLENYEILENRVRQTRELMGHPSA